MAFQITPRIAKEAGDRLGVNWEVLPLEDLVEGMQVEMEHGSVNAQEMVGATKAAARADAVTNVTDDDFIMTAKIALAHFAEGINYYRYLAQLERRLEDERRGKGFLDVFLPMNRTQFPLQ